MQTQDCGETPEKAQRGAQTDKSQRGRAGGETL